MPDPYSGFGARFHNGQVWAPGDDAIGVFDIATGAQVATLPGISADSFAGVSPSEAGMWVRGPNDSLRLVDYTTFQVNRTFDTIPGTLLEAAGNELWLKRDDGRGHKAIRVDATTGEEIDTYRPGGPNPVDEVELGE